MIQLYISKNTIPSNMEIIDDIDMTFDYMIYTDKIRMDNIDKEIVKKIDKAKVREDGLMDTPFSNGVSIDRLSTGCKTLILANHLGTNQIINISQCGNNALNMLFNLDNKSYYLSYCIIPSNTEFKFPVKVNNRKKLYNGAYDLLEVWRDL